LYAREWEPCQQLLCFNLEKERELLVVRVVRWQSEKMWWEQEQWLTLSTFSTNLLVGNAHRLVEL